MNGSTSGCKYADLIEPNTSVLVLSVDMYAIRSKFIREYYGRNYTRRVAIRDSGCGLTRVRTTALPYAADSLISQVITIPTYLLYGSERWRVNNAVCDYLYLSNLCKVLHEIVYHDFDKTLRTERNMIDYLLRNKISNIFIYKEHISNYEIEMNEVAANFNCTPNLITSDMLQFKINYA